MDMPHGKLILDMDAMMKKFWVDDPLQLLDMFEVAMNYLPEELGNLRQAIEKKDHHAIYECVHSLKGALGYLSAPKCEELILKWHDFLCHQTPSKETLLVMLNQIESALIQLCDAIDQTIDHIKNANI